MTENFRPHPENPKQHAPEAGEGLHGFSDRQPAQLKLQQGNTADDPTIEKKIEQSRLTKQSWATFENCVVSSLMPSVSQVEERLAEGRITEEQATAEMKKALLKERHYMLGDRAVAVQNMLAGGGLLAEERQSLRAEYKSLRKEIKRIRQEQREDE
jgi:hypothetical protein